MKLRKHRVKANQFAIPFGSCILVSRLDYDFDRVYCQRTLMTPPLNPQNEPPANNVRPGNPTPLDVLFILSASITILLFLLWVLPGNGTRFSNPPQFILTMVKSIWAKLSFAAGSATVLVIRKFVETRPSPNYLLWIPGFVMFMIVALFALSKALPAQSSQNSLRVALSLALDHVLEDPDNLRGKYGIPDFYLWENSPHPGVTAHGVLFNSTANPSFPYQDTLSVNRNEKSIAYIKLNPAISHTQGSDNTFDYGICLNQNLSWSGSDTPTIKLKCASKSCVPAKDVDIGFVLACELGLVQGRRGDLWSLPAVYADEITNAKREPGWDVPSLENLQKMTDRERVGYTEFDVSFTPKGKAAEADSYYFALRVNGQPVYISGLSPDLQKVPLQQGNENHLKFALENLNFTGQYSGYEKLELRVYFLSKDNVVFYQDLSRDYVALRDASKIPSLETEVGTFQWAGAYIPPHNENKYEVLVTSADCGNPPQKNCVDRAVRAKQQFDRIGLKLGSNPVVMVIRPPLRVPPAYGLALGLVQTTSQVQFTFSQEETRQVCSWAIDQSESGKAHGLIRSDLRIYEAATRGYFPCHR